MTKTIRVLDIKKHAAHMKLRDLVGLRRKVGTNVDDMMPAVEQAIAAAHPDREKLIAAVTEANGKATAHTYEAHHVESIAERAEQQLARDGITVEHRVGTIVTAVSEVPTSKAYNRQSRSAIATRVVLRRTTACWVLEKVERCERYTGPGGDEKIAITISEAARDDIVRRALDGYAIAKPIAVDVAA
jgi:hypothetical protein